MIMQKYQGCPIVAPTCDRPQNMQQYKIFDQSLTQEIFGKHDQMSVSFSIGFSNTDCTQKMCKLHL